MTPAATLCSSRTIAAGRPETRSWIMPNRDRLGTSARGFAAMDEQKQREIASKGGHSVPPEERSFARNRELAAQAGRKGGHGVAPENRSFSRDPALAAQAGRKGG